MSKRYFGAIKSLLHFDFPYFNEPNDGLDDEVGLESWSKGNSNTTLCGSIQPRADSRAPKFGYRCLRPFTGGIIGSNISGIWNMNSNGNYEIECFIFGTSTGNRSLLQLFDANNSKIFDVSITSSRYITFLCPDWGIDNVATSSSFFAESSWQHVLLRVSKNSLKFFIEGIQVLNLNLTPNVTLAVNKVQLGYSSSKTALYIDEFVFRHAAAKGNPKIPTEPYSGFLDISKAGGFGNGSDGDVVISANSQINSYASVSAVSDNKSFSIGNISNGSYPFEAGREIMIFITAQSGTTLANSSLSGLYAFAKISNIENNSIVLDRDISIDNNCDFSLNQLNLSSYWVQAVTVPNFKSLTVNSGKTINTIAHACWEQNTWNTSFTIKEASSGPGGVIVFRCLEDCNVNGSIITHGKGPIRYDLHQMTHSKLIDRFLISQGGGIFIACGGTFFASSSARLGATWNGNGDGSNGAAGYGGKGGNVNPSSTISASGGAGGVGGGGGGAACSSASSANAVSGGSAGSNGYSTTVGAGGGGCGGNGGSGSSYVGGSGGGGQGGSFGAAGASKSTTSTSIGIYTYVSNGVNGGYGGTWDTNVNSSTATCYYGGAGGGAPGGNGGYGFEEKSATAYNKYSGGIAGASIILICNKLKADEAALSTGGGAGVNGTVGYTRAGMPGGGGTGFCYIACNERLSA